MMLHSSGLLHRRAPRNDREPMSRRVWLIALCFYAAAAAIDMAAHLNGDSQAGRNWRDPANLAVAFSAGLFWPADLIAALLLR